MKKMLHYFQVLLNIIRHPKVELYYLYQKYGTRMWKICRNKVVFSSWNGKGYTCNPRYISEEILRQKKPWKIVWILDKESRKDAPKGIKVVAPGTIRSLREIASARVIVSNTRGCYGVKKKEGQVYLQTWHGGMGFKRIEKAVEDRLDAAYVQLAKQDGDQCDAILSNCSFLTEEYRENFWLNTNTQILEYGLPRNDALFDEGHIQRAYAEVRRKYGFQPDQKIVLYMPTFRDDNMLDGYLLDYEKLIDAMEARFGGQFAVIVRMHPNVLQQADCIAYGGKVANGTEYPDVQELYMAADYMISDYSSAVFDFALQRKPVFLCLLDYQAYLKERGLNKIFYKCPFPHSYSYEELVEQISSFDEDAYWRNFDAFQEEWKMYDDGHAAVRTVAWIEGKIGEMTWQK